MVYILGVLLKEGWLAKNAFQQIYGIGPHIAQRLLARFQIHDTARIGDLAPSQITQIATFLTSPSTAPPIPTLPLAKPGFKPPPTTPAAPQLSKRQQNGEKLDPLKSLKIEGELKRDMRENIAHHRLIGSYVGRRHAMHLPVRGQRTKSNARTARKLNRIERKY